MDLLQIWAVTTLIFAVQAQLESSEINCKTPGRQDGICISTSSCQAYQDVLKSTDPVQWPLAKQVYSCGLDRVCCPKNKTEFSMRSVSTVPPPKVLLPEDCGVINTVGTTLNGTETGVFEFPWMARLLYAKPDRKIFGCGGTIINERYILTAAHCIDDQHTIIGVRVGDHNFETEEDCDIDEDGYRLCAPPPQNLTIEEKIPHPDFFWMGLTDDIGLLRVSRMDFSKANVKPICLPVGKRNFTFEGRYGVVTGWGITKYQTESPELLKFLLRVRTHKECQEAYGRSANISFEQMCAGGIERGFSCKGDSGGPLQVVTQLHRSTRYVQLGIVSFSMSRLCRAYSWPTVFTRITSYMDWILNTIKP